MKKITLNLCGYFCEVAISKVSQESEPIIENVDRDELEEFVNSMEYGDINEDFTSLYPDSKCHDIKFDEYKHYVIADMSDMSVYIGDSEKPIDGIDNDKTYEFLTYDGGTKTLSAYLPDVGAEDCGKDYNNHVVKVMNECVSGGYVDAELYGEMTFLNRPEGMVLVEFYRNRGAFEVEIELEDDEEFDPAKFFFADFDDWDEYAVIGQYNAVPLDAIIYNNKWYPVQPLDSMGQSRTKFLTEDFARYDKTICVGKDEY